MNDYIELVDEGTNPLMPYTDMDDQVESADRPLWCTHATPRPPLWSAVYQSFLLHPDPDY